MKKGAALLLIAIAAGRASADPDPVAVSSVTTAGTASSATASILLTLPQSIERALDQATLVLKAKNDVAFNGTQLLQAYAQFLPNLDVGGEYSKTQGRIFESFTTPTIVDTINHGASYQLSSTFNLFNGLFDIASLRSASNRSSVSNLSLYRAKQQIRLDVTQAYLQVLLDGEIVKIGEANLKSSQEREKLLQEQTRVGLRSLADLYRQQAQTSSDEIFLINSRNRERDDLILLLRRLRLDIRKEYALQNVPYGTPPTADPYEQEQALMQQALDNRADLRAAQALSNAAHADVTAARSGYWPRLDLGADYFGAGRILDKQIVNGTDELPMPQRGLNTQLGDQTYYTLGATLSWGLFDRGITRLAVERASVAAKNTDIDLEDHRLQVEGEVKQSYFDYHSSLQQLISAAKGVKAAKEAFDAVQARYGVGAASFIDLLTSQSALVQAQANEAQAQMGYLLQASTMEFVLGKTDVH
jgi:outer membrane protein